MAVEVEPRCHCEAKRCYISVILYDYIKKLPLHNFQMLCAENDSASVFVCDAVLKNAGHKAGPKCLSSKPRLRFREKRRNDVVSVWWLINPRGESAYWCRHSPQSLSIPLWTLLR